MLDEETRNVCFAFQFLDKNSWRAKIFYDLIGYKVFEQMNDKILMDGDRTR